MRKPTKEEEDYIRENLRYDPETGHLWWTKPSGMGGRQRSLDKPVGSYRKGYLIFGIPKSVSGSSSIKYPLIHRIAWFLYYGVWPDELLDHINGVRADNRIENLRPASHRENSRNRKPYKSFSSRHKGVHWRKCDSRWISQIKYSKGKQKHLGSYTSEEEAARAYDKAARELFGEYAYLNFPDEHEQGALNGHDV